MNTAQQAFVRFRFTKWVEETDVAEQCGLTRKELIDSVEFNDPLEFNHLHVVRRGYIENTRAAENARPGYQSEKTGDPQGEPPHCGTSVTPPPVEGEPSWEECMESAGIAVTDAHRRVVAQLESTGLPGIGYLLPTVLRAPALSVTEAAEGIRKLMGALPAEPRGDPLDASQADDVLTTVRTLVVDHSVTCQELIDGMTYVAQIRSMGLKLGHIKDAVTQKFVSIHPAEDPTAGRQQSEPLGGRVDEPAEAKHCTCHERDGSYACDYCYKQGHRGHMDGE